MTLQSLATALLGETGALRRVRRRRRALDAVGLGIMLGAVVSIAWLANSGMQRIHEGLASQLFEQQRDVAGLAISVTRAHALLDEAAHGHGHVHADAIARGLDDITDALTGMRRQYPFDSVDGASAAHALVYPVLVDVQRWTTRGVSGYAAGHPVVWELAHRRFGGMLGELHALRDDISAQAQRLLVDEAAQVEQLRLNLLIAILAAGMLAISFALAIMRQRNAESRAALAHGRLLDAVQAVPQGFALFDGDDHLVLCNDRFGELYPGDDSALTAGRSFAAVTEFIEQVSRVRTDDDDWSNAPLEPRTVSGPILAERPDGSFVQIEARPTQEGGTVLVESDVTLRRRTEERLRHLATHDALTGLPGRRHFDHRLSQALHAARRYDHEVTLMCIDVDYFKRVNDSYGHPVGDSVLVAVAERLRQSVRDHDIVARLSGDEFAVVMANTLSREDAELTARRILSGVAVPIETAAGTVTQTVSVGVASFPRDAVSPDALVASADGACYRAKHDGRNRVFFHGDAA